MLLFELFISSKFGMYSSSQLFLLFHHANVTVTVTVAAVVIAVVIIAVWFFSLFQPNNRLVIE